MKRSDRKGYRSGYRKRRRKSLGEGQRLYILIAVLLILAGAWYLYTHRDHAMEQYREFREKTHLFTEPEEESQERQEEPGEEETPEAPKIEGEKRTVGAVYRIDGTRMETSDGDYTLAENVRLYTTGGPVEWENLNSLTGMEDVSLFLNGEDKVSSIQISQAVMVPSRLGILLANPDGGYIFSAPSVSCSTDYWADASGKVETHRKDEAYTPSGDGRIVLEGASQDSVWSTAGGTFRGTLELVPEDGGWYIVDRVYLEQYLCGVVPSEMPESLGSDAAKIQAVCSRSFAYTQWKGSTKFAHYGAHMDNTVNSQVYGMSAETEASLTGVEQTRGQMLLYEGEVVNANFFSTSCGMTADAGDVWANARTGEFPADTPRYLKGQAQYTEGDYGDLSDEEAFYAFITRGDIPSYDSESPWYRWNTVISLDGIEESWNARLQKLYEMRPYLVETLTGDTFESRPVESIGSIVNVYAYSRASSGILTELLVEGSEKTVKIRGENSIRSLLASAGITVRLADGTERVNPTLLPSAFFAIEKGVNSEGQLLQLTLHGGGYGHGVGMSQMGAYGMLQAGYGWEDVLRHYYDGIEIGFVPLPGEPTDETAG